MSEFFCPVRYLFILMRVGVRHADDTDGVVWGGVTYETEDGRPSGSVEEETVDLGNDGVTISATEAVLITL